MIHSQRIHARRARSLGSVHPFTASLLAALVVVAASLLVPRIRVRLDDLRYGRPRTMHLAAHVGHEDAPGRPTQFVAMNLDREPIILEFPGGDVGKARTLKLPRLVGVDADLVPIVMTLELVNPDKIPDLVINVQGEEFIYINTGTEYRLINDAERAAIGGTD